MHDVVIVGAGMAGSTAALWCARLGRTFAWVDAGYELGGQLANVYNPISDYPARETADGAGFARVLADQLAHSGLLPRVATAATSIDCAAPSVTLADGERLPGRALVLCTGVRARSLAVPGEAELESAGRLARSASRDGERCHAKRALVIGGGDGAVECALALTAHGASHVTLVHRGERLRARDELRERLAREAPQTELLLSTEVRTLDPITVSGPGGERKLDAEIVFLKLGYDPASELVAGQVELDGDGYIRCDGNQRTTASAPVYAAGDVCTPHTQSLVVAAGQAMIAIKAIDSALAQVRP